MATVTFYLIDNNSQNAQQGDEVTFQLTSSTGGQVPVVIPYEVFGSDNTFVLENPGTPSATRQVLPDSPFGPFLVTWETDEPDTAAATSATEGEPAQQQSPPASLARRQHQGTIRIGTTM